MLLLPHARLVQKCFLEKGGEGDWWWGLIRGWALINFLGFQGGRLLIFWAFREGAYSRWALIRIKTVNEIVTKSYK